MRKTDIVRGFKVGDKIKATKSLPTCFSDEIIEIGEYGRVYQIILSEDHKTPFLKIRWDRHDYKSSLLITSKDIEKI